MPDPQPPRRRLPFNPRELRGVGLLSAVGITLVICSAIGTAIGYWVDDTWKTDPWGKAVGFLLGTIAGFVEMFRTLMKVNEDDDG